MKLICEVNEEINYVTETLDEATGKKGLFKVDLLRNLEVVSLPFVASENVLKPVNTRSEIPASLILKFVLELFIDFNLKLPCFKLLYIY